MSNLLVLIGLRHVFPVSGFHLIGIRQPWKQFRNVCQAFISIFQGTRVWWFCYVVDVECILLLVFWPTSNSLFLQLHISLIISSSANLFEIQRRSGRLKQKSFVTKDKDTGGFYMICVPFCLTFFNLESNRFRTRNGIKFWMKKIIMNSAEEPGFRWT